MRSSLRTGPHLPVKTPKKHKSLGNGRACRVRPLFSLLGWLVFRLSVECKMVYLRIRSRAAGNDEQQLCLPNDRALTAIAEILNRVFQETNKQAIFLFPPHIPPSLPCCEGLGRLSPFPQDAGLGREFCSPSVGVACHSTRAPAVGRKDAKR
jgi:hypothetical protein